MYLFSHGSPDFYTRYTNLRIRGNLIIPGKELKVHIFKGAQVHCQKMELVKNDQKKNGMLSCFYTCMLTGKLQHR